MINPSNSDNMDDNNDGNNISKINIEKLSKEFESCSPQEILDWSIKNFGAKIGLASSFGAEDVVLIDMMVKIDKTNTKIFTLDTGRLNKETYFLMDEIRKKYDIQFDVYFPDTSEVEEMVKSKGFNLMYENIENRKLCCGIRKVHPLNRALLNMAGWITGLRRDQSITRSNVNKIELDSSHNHIIKLNPLADWDNDMIWNYIKEYNVPYNQLHDNGYPSIGCEPCTRAINKGDDIRSGRWWWEEPSSKECGLHISQK